MNPTQLKWIYLENQFEKKPAKYKTWTQISYLEEWPPCTSAVFFWWKATNTIIVGANYDEHTVDALRDWRLKYSINISSVTPAGKFPTHRRLGSWGICGASLLTTLFSASRRPNCFPHITCTSLSNALAADSLSANVTNPKPLDSPFDIFLMFTLRTSPNVVMYLV